LDDQRFDSLTRRFASPSTRRGVLGGLLAGAMAIGGRRTASAAKSGKIGVCHATGSASKPYTYIEVSQSAVSAHLAHGDAIAPDFATDASNCGDCGVVCPTSDACMVASCMQGGPAQFPLGMRTIAAVKQGVATGALRAFAPPICATQASRMSAEFACLTHPANAWSAYASADLRMSVGFASHSNPASLNKFPTAGH
jgi:hypothetical protein